MRVNDIFVVMGIIIVASFLGATFFRKTRIPNPILLIGVGLALGHFNSGFNLVLLQQLAPFFGSLALLLILLEAGLDLNISHFFQNFGRSLLFGVASFCASMAACYAFLHDILELEQIQSLILASVGVGASPAILVPVIKSLGLREQTRTFFDLECTVTEVMGLIVTVVLIPFILPAVEGLPILVLDIISKAGEKFLHIGLLAFFIPTSLGLIWSRLLSFAGERPLWSVLTIGMALLLFGLSESGGGKGALNVLVFGMIIGNGPFIFKKLRKLARRVFRTRGMRRLFIGVFIGQHHAEFHTVSREISFLVRTFFFVYLGVIVDFSSLTQKTVVIAVVLTLVPIFIRIVLGWLSKSLVIAARENLALFAVLSPRGLANAVAAFTVIGAIEASHLQPQQKELWQELIVTPIFGVILLSNLIMTLFLIMGKNLEAIPPSGLDIEP
jgi:cell volume regulation protein A